MSFRPPRWIAAILVCVSASISAPLATQAARPPLLGRTRVHWRMQRPSLDYQSLIPQRERLEAFRLADEAQVDVLERHHLRFRADGSIEETRTLARLFLKKAALRQGTQSFAADLAESDATVLQAYVVTPHGEYIQVPQEHLVVRNLQTPGLFTNEYSITAPFSRLGLDCITVLKFKLVHHASDWALPWSNTYFLDSFNPIEKLELRLEWDTESVKPNWAHDSSTAKETVLGHNSVLITQIHGTKLHTDPSMPPLPDFAHQLTVSRAASWPALVSQARSLIEKVMVGGTDLQSQLSALVFPQDPPSVKLAKIHSFVASSIRYVGFEQGRDGVIPRPSSTTLKRGFGDCKDKTVLFIELLRAAGIPAWPALVASSRSRLEKLLVPAAGYFDHAIACYTLDQKTHCTDLTAPYSPHWELPGSLVGAVYLPLLDGTHEPSLLPVPAEAWLVRFEAERTLNPDGSLHELAREKYFSVAAAELRALMAEMSTEERTRWALTRYRRAVGDAPVPTFRFRGTDELSGPLTIERNATYPNVLTRGDGELQFWDGYLANELRSLVTENQWTEDRLFGMRYDSEVHYRFPKGTSAAYLGPTLDFETAFASLSRTYTRTEDGVQVSTELTVPPNVIAVSQLETSAQEFRYLMNETRHLIGLR